MRESMGISENLCKSHTWKVATCEQECHGRSVREIVFVRVWEKRLRVCKRIWKMESVVDS